MTLKTVWNNDGENGYIRSNVDNQDNYGLEDLKDTQNGGSALKSVGQNLVNNNAIVKDIRDISGATALGGSSERAIPTGTDVDNNFENMLKVAKTQNYKNVKLSSKLGTFAGINSLLSSALGLMVGSMGKSSVANIIDEHSYNFFVGDASNSATKFLTGLGLGSLEKLDGIGEKIPTATEITSLLLANYYTMYENKPGRLVRNRYNKYNFIDVDLDDNLDGTKEGDDDKNWFSKATSVIKTGTTFASDILNGNLLNKGIEKLIGKESKLSQERTLIISTQRSEYERSIGTRTKWGANTGPNLEKNTKNSKKMFAEHSPEEWFDIQDEEGNKNKIYDRVNDSFKHIGCLYVEPFQNDNKINPMIIPFEFNPTISGDTLEAKYNTEELMGRLLSVRSYVGSDAGTLTLETQYLVLTNNEKSNENDQWLNGWMNDWTPETLAKIEKAYRALVLPYIDEKIFVRPPIVRIHLTTTSSNANYNNGSKRNVDGKEVQENVKDNIYNTTVGDLFSYPVDENDKGVLEVTGTLDGCRRIKRYIVTSLDISPLGESWGINYGLKEAKGHSEASHYIRNGFKVTLSLAETTKNFLDTVPNYRHYVTLNKEGSLLDLISSSSSASKGNKTNPEGSLLDEIYSIDYFKVDKSNKEEYSKDSVPSIIDNEKLELFSFLYKKS